MTDNAPVCNIRTKEDTVEKFFIVNRIRQRVLSVFFVASFFCYELLTISLPYEIIIKFLSSILIVYILWITESYTRYLCATRLLKLLGIITSIVIVIIRSLNSVFFERCNSSIKAMTIINLLCMDKDSILKLLRIALAIVSFFSVAFMSTLMWSDLFAIEKIIAYREVLKKIKHAFAVKRFIMSICSILISTFIAVGFLMAVHCIPQMSIEKNAKLSAELFEHEGISKQLYRWCNSGLDNYTDGAMINMASYVSNKSLYDNAMFVYAGSIDGVGSSCESLIKHFVDGVEYIGEASTPRYWRGFVIILRPLLCFMDYHHIRILNGFIQSALLITLFVLLRRNKKGKYIFPTFIAYLMLMPIVMMKNMNFSTCLYISIMGAIVVLILYERSILDRYSWFLFLIIGIVLAFFDLLTMPVITYCIPALVCVMIEAEQNIDEKIGSIISRFIFWGLGYAGMWSAKWIIATMTTNTNVILNAYKDILFRIGHTGVDGVHYSTLNGIFLNFSTFEFTPFYLVFLAYIIYKVKSIGTEVPVSTMYKRIIPYLILSLIPILWYIVTTNHSTIHYWFTNKDLVVVVLAISFSLLDIESDCGMILPKEVGRDEG